METLDTLQEKVDQLIALVKELKQDNIRLAKENKQLLQKQESLTANAESDSHDLKRLHEERALTKEVVDELINSIDSLMTQAEQ